MNIIFIGGFFPENYTATIIEKSKLQVQNAANNFQWAFIKGLEQNLNHSIKLLTAPYIGWYPKYYKDLIFRKAYFSNNDNLESDVMVGFLNLPGIKNIFKFFNLKSALRHLLNSNSRNIIFVYSTDWAYLKAALKAKSKNPNTTICAIITDCYDWKENKGFFNKLKLKNIVDTLPLKMLAKADCFVVLTDKMADYLKIANKPWVRVEGIFDEEAISKIEINLKDNVTKIILYTGTLEYPYGIKELLGAFELITSTDYQLWICGSGSGKKLVQQRAQEDKRITYFGIVGREKITELQAKATILVNPRNTIGEYNKYSFPSKTMEYFASGTPALLYKLEGIPEEYFDFCYTVGDNKVETLSKAIFDTCQLKPDILKLKGESAKDFILKNKTAKIQCGKVIEMIDNM
jgi:glycosyltransferase involved in cell wall biosynthesis